MSIEKRAKFNEKADAELDRVYREAAACSTEAKIEALNKILGGEANFYSFGDGQVSNEMKLGCLEYEYLGNIGLIELVLA